MSEPVSVRARFDRFPATVKGAFLVRGEDADPHQLAINGARLVRVGGGRGQAGQALPIDPVFLDVPPHKDLFVPFEIPTVDLDPGWYGFEVDAELDGSPRVFPGGRRFAVAWPRSAVRTGTLRVDRTVEVGAVAVAIEQVRLDADGAAVRFRSTPPEPVRIHLAADEERLEVAVEEFDPASGRGTVRAYPVPRGAGSLVLELSAGRGKRAGTAEMTLPLG